LSADGKRGPWTYVGIGCTIAAFLVLAAIVAAAYWLYEWSSRAKDEMTDPAVREVKAKAVLGCTQIPRGYQASFAVSVPFVMDLAILGDREPASVEDGQFFERRGYLYVKTLKRKTPAEIEAFFEGKAEVDQIAPGAGVTIREAEEIGRGTVERGDVRIRYLARKGTITVRGAPVAGITSFLFFECPGDTRTRIGIWFGPDESAGKDEAVRYAGTPADPEAIRAFTSHFSPCGS
jgi:hypothetical protein